MIGLLDSLLLARWSCRQQNADAGADAVNVLEVPLSEFKTLDDLEEAVLSLDLRTTVQRHLQVLAGLAMKLRGFSPGEAIPEEAIWSSDDFPKRAAADAPSTRTAP